MLDVSSPTILIDIAIAQGSCLCPLMCIVYMDDIVRCSIEINFLIYTEDTTLFVSAVDLGQCVSIMNQHFVHVYHWLYMRLNVSRF